MLPSRTCRSVEALKRSRPSAVAGPLLCRSVDEVLQGRRVKPSLCPSLEVLDEVAAFVSEVQHWELEWTQRSDFSRYAAEPKGEPIQIARELIMEHFKDDPAPDGQRDAIRGMIDRLTKFVYWHHDLR